MKLFNSLFTNRTVLTEQDLYEIEHPDGETEEIEPKEIFSVFTSSESIVQRSNHETIITGEYDAWA